MNDAFLCTAKRQESIFAHAVASQSSFEVPFLRVRKNPVFLLLLKSTKSSFSFFHLSKRRTTVKFRKPDPAVVALPSHTMSFRPLVFWIRLVLSWTGDLGFMHVNIASHSGMTCDRILVSPCVLGLKEERMFHRERPLSLTNTHTLLN